MKTTERVITTYGHGNLVRSIVKTVGKDSFEDIYNHGADAGYPGITYTGDCMDLAWKNKVDILEMLEEYASDFGKDLGKMIQGWKCIGQDYSPSEIVKSLYKGKPKWESDIDRTVWNSLAWFAAEEVARWFCD